MRIGIVGSEAAKFTPETEEKAREAIRTYLVPGNTIISGRCHLGGIDIWAIEEAVDYGLPYIEYPPEQLSWKYYEKRNIQIAESSDKVVCITVKTLPKGYKGMKFRTCYHCKTLPNHHVKSGGCWTMKQAKLMGKEGELVVIE